MEATLCISERKLTFFVIFYTVNYEFCLRRIVAWQEKVLFFNEVSVLTNYLFDGVSILARNVPERGVCWTRCLFERVVVLKGICVCFINVVPIYSCSKNSAICFYTVSV